MHWIAPSEKDVAAATLEKNLWTATDQFRANSGLKAQEYSGPILGLIFLRFAEVRFAAQRTKLEAAATSSRRGSRVDEPAAYHADNVLYLSPEARFDYLLTLPEASDIGASQFWSLWPAPSTASGSSISASPAMNPLPSFPRRWWRFRRG